VTEYLPDRPVRAVGVAMLDSLHEHRLLSTAQLRELHTPNAKTSGTRRVLRDLERRKLVAVTRGRGPTKLYYLTPAGGRAIQSIAARRESHSTTVPTPEQAAGPLRAHTLSVNDVGVAFVRAARVAGDDCGPLAWEHEVSHPIGSTPGRRGAERVISDALLTYLRTDDDGVTVHQRLIELDRMTASTHALAAKLSRYARLYRHTGAKRSDPLWKTRYETFPGVLVALTGGSVQSLDRRRQTVLALCAHDALLTSTPQVEIAFCLLDELIARGPFSPIFLTLRDPQHWTDWLGATPASEGSE